jgi:hypothetical protein
MSARCCSWSDHGVVVDMVGHYDSKNYVACCSWCGWGNWVGHRIEEEKTIKDAKGGPPKLLFIHGNTLLRFLISTRFKHRFFDSLDVVEDNILQMANKCI